MPLFEYKCQACGREFEVLILRESQAVECPACGGTEVERLISMFAVNSEARRESAVSSARRYNEKLNKKQDPDKPRVQIDHKHQH